ncbi:zinc-ribbon domain-containing protein [Lacticaseibacillus chiayiensis]|uniref:zinc-ribbon domain-containing protein n=1 Tax=Lacticaseibacillus chiayiensis TaxID=2100821 RepID=UPI003C78FE7E
MQASLKFCPNCGQPIGPDDDFCANCGFDLRTARQQAQNTSQKESAKSQSSPATPSSTASATLATAERPRSPRSPRRWLLVTGIAVILILGIAYFAGAAYYSQDRQVTELAEEMTSGDADDMAEVAVASDGTALHEDDLKPLAQLIKNRSDRGLLHNMIMAKSTSGMVQIVKAGHELLIFPKYKIKLGTADAVVKTNLKNATLTLNGTPAQAKAHDGQYIITGQLPGVYTLKLSGTHDGSTKDFTREVVIPLKGQALDLTLDAATAPSSSATASQNSHPASDTHADDNDDDYDDNGVAKTTRQYPSDTSKRNDNHSTSGIVGRWESGDQATFTFNSDGTYTATNNGTPSNGKWEVVYRDGNIFNIKFTKSDGGSIVEPFALDDDDLIETNLKIKWERDD